MQTGGTHADFPSSLWFARWQFAADPFSAFRPNEIASTFPRVRGEERTESLIPLRSASKSLISFSFLGSDALSRMQTAGTLSLTFSSLRFGQRQFTADLFSIF
jgi:hypothetical protein